jgi:hypothetical protein
MYHLSFDKLRKKFANDIYMIFEASFAMFSQAGSLVDCTIGQGHYV